MNLSSKKIKNKAMQTLALTFTVGAFVLFISCNSSSENLQNAKEEVNEANEDLNEAQQEYAEEVKLFRIEANKKITENEEKNC